MIFAKLKYWAIVVGAALVAAAAIFLKGQSAGKATEKAKQMKADAQAQVKRNETVKTALDVAKDVGSLSGGSAEQRLRDKYTRD